MRRTLTLLLAICTGLVSGQTGFDNLRNIIPPSPDASSIAKYGSWPVGLYTGLPNIGVPIYELKGKDISVPISLSYHASGNSVGAVASWVGLGWSLQAGGLITRSIKGLPDDVGYFSLIANYTNPNDLSSSSDAVRRNMDQVGAAKSDLDTQEDMYSFNALGRSYKLLIKADGSIETMPFSNIKVLSNPMVGNAAATANQSWTVLLEDGTKLVFGGTGNFKEQTDNPTFQRGDGPGIQYISSWYLNSITSPKGEVVQFAYTPTYIEQDAYFSQSDNIEYIETFNVGFCPIITHQGVSSTTQVLQVNGLVLSSIESTLGKVEFMTDPNERQDLSGGHRLAEIKVFSKSNNQYIKDYLFNSSYTTAVAGNALLLGQNNGYFGYRLHLDSLQLRDPGNSLLPVQQWTFDYNPQCLPSRRSYAQDHWGFFNGATSNNSLLPPVDDNPLIPSLAPKVGFTPPFHDLGANRSTNPEYIQAEMLTTIHYPTGGSSSFIYEPNGYSTDDEIFTQQQKDFSLYLAGGSQVNTQSVDFTVTKAQNIFLYLESYITGTLLNDQPGATVTATIYDQNNHVVGGSQIINNSDNQYIYLPNAGTYRYTLSTNIDPSSLAVSGFVYATASTYITYQQSEGIQTVTHYVGGLRLSSIADRDGISGNKVDARYFKYEDPFIINPLDTNNDYLTIIKRDTYDVSSGLSCYFSKVVRNSSTKFSLGSIEGGTVGYGKVTTYHGLNGTNGTTESNFNNAPDYYLQEASLFPYPASDSRDWQRGLLLHQMDYDAGHSLVKQIDNTYSFTRKGYIVGFKAGYGSFRNNSFCTTGAGTCGINLMYCTTSNEQVKLLSTTNTIKDQSNGNLSSNTVNYTYGDPLNTRPTQIATTNSKGESIITTNKYPFDLSTTSPYDEMVNRNMVAPIVQQIKSNTTLNKEMARTNTAYQYWQGNALIEPTVFQNSFSGNALETEATVNSCDAKGNVLQVTGRDGAVTSYLYGYSSQYPVAKVSGSTYATISSLINQSTLDNPSNDAALRTELDKIRTGLAGSKALVTTITYLPLIGKSSETDPSGHTTYYEFDGLNRLKTVRDEDGNVLKTYDYQYQK